MNRYKGYEAEITYSMDDQLLVGRVKDIEGLVMFSAASVEDLAKAFHEAVDEYLLACEEDRIEPERPYKGSFNVRIGPERHRRAAYMARKWKISLNEFMGVAVDQAVDRHQNGDTVTLDQRAVPVPPRDVGYSLGAVSPDLGFVSATGPAYKIN